MHLIITNFCVGIFEPRYIEYRIRLFECILAKSLNAQTNTSFTHVIIVDKLLPSEFKERLIATGKNYRVRLLEVDFYYQRLRIVEQFIQTTFDTEQLITTTRIDDDDALHRDAVKWLQVAVTAAAERQPFKHHSSSRLVIAFETGVEVDVVSGRYRSASYPSIGLGLTMASLASQTSTIYGWAHHGIFDTARAEGWSTVSYNGRPWWFYSKHKLSDSSFAGFLGRLARQAEVSLSPSELRRFGLAVDDLKSIAEVDALTPHGISEKYLVRLSNIESQVRAIANDTSEEAVQKREKLVRERYQNGMSVFASTDRADG